jgi:hypothetical protein
MADRKISFNTSFLLVQKGSEISGIYVPLSFVGTFYSLHALKVL